MIDLKARPFFLDDEAIQWVEETRGAMTLEEKAGQVFCALGFNREEAFLKHLISDIKIGGMMYRPGPAVDTQDTHRTIQNMAKIPLLLAANTEAGGNGLAIEGTSFGQPLAVAATGNPEDAYRMGYAACAEGAALGLNWAFAPIVDIDMEFRNPITNTRTFGSNPERIIACATEYMKAADENKVAVSIKHFPGDGVDERDQHLLTSVNSLNCEEWDRTYGEVYQTLINRNAKTVMVGHIAQPAYVKRMNEAATNEELLRPASLSKEIVSDLLRGKLGFNGLVSTDATPMVGFTTAMPRSKAIPTAIAAGVDMILFNKSIDEDYQYLLDGIKSGIVTEERLDEAVTRILATKASLQLHIKQRNNTLVPGVDQLSVVGNETHRAWAKEVADKAITLVKDTKDLLPISPAKFKRVYLNVIQKDVSPENPYVQSWKALFEKEGFEVTVRNRTTSIDVVDMMNPETMTQEKINMVHEMYRGVEEMKKEYDLYVYIVNMETESNNTTIRLNWNVAFGLGDDAPWMASEIPVMMISTANPYHMFDAPMIPTFINAYSGTPDFCEAIMEKIMGRSEFKGISPVDPFCGKEYLRMTAEK